MIFNFLSKNTVGRLIGRQDDSCAIYFAKMGMIQNIPSKLVQPFTFKSDTKDKSIAKQAKKIADEEFVINRQGIFIDNDYFQILKINDKTIEVRWLTGNKMGQKEEISKDNFTDKNVSWATVNELAKFSAVWNGKFYQIKTANWNEKRASILDQFESHIDNVQHDITCIMPMSKGKYAKSFGVTTKFGNMLLKFDAKVANENLDLDVKAIQW